MMAFFQIEGTTSRRRESLNRRVRGSISTEALSLRFLGYILSEPQVMIFRVVMEVRAEVEEKAKLDRQE